MHQHYDREQHEIIGSDQMSKIKHFVRIFNICADNLAQYLLKGF